MCKFGNANPYGPCPDCGGIHPGLTLWLNLEANHTLENRLAYDRYQREARKKQYEKQLENTDGLGI